MKKIAFNPIIYMKILALILVLFFLFWFVCFEVVLFMRHNLNEKNTVEHTATVTYVEILEGNNDSVCIHIKEHHFGLYFKMEITEKTPAEYLSLIQSGDTITYRIEDNQDKNLTKKYERIKGIRISSLTSDNEVIFTLEDHNNYEKPGWTPGKIIIAVIISFFLFVMFLIIRSLLEDKGIIKRKKRKIKKIKEEAENPFSNPLY